jgi:glycosyltransferase involved in cell wall biosynthesis
MVAHHLWHSDVFVLPSRREALGVAALEAMAAGLPVVATAVGGIPEMVRSGREGVLVPADHPNELAAALVRLLMDSDTRVRMAAAAKQRAEEFSVRVMTQSLRKTYLQLAASGST